MIRNSERNRIKKSENDQDDKVTYNEGVKQFGSSNINKSFMTVEPHLKVKANYKSEDVFKSNSTKKTVPLKRTESSVGLKHYSDSKRKTVEKTYRHKEQEKEWSPEGLDLDLGLFDNQVYDRTKNVFDTMDELSIPQRAFTVEIKDNIELNDLERVEYGPPKEIELPYEPEQSCLVDVSNFTDYADISAYEIMSSVGKGLLEFNSIQDEDVLDTLTNRIYQHDEFEFESESDSELDMTYQNDTLQIPFSNYLFDVEHFLQCN